MKRRRKSTIKRRKRKSINAANACALLDVLLGAWD